jgi:hypothetical protein
VRPKWAQRGRQWLPAAATVAAVLVIFALLWPITDLIAAHDVGRIAGPQRADHLQSAREAVRTQLLTLGAGVFAAGALIFTGLNFVLSRRTFELTEQGQVTDRYTKAVEQLGSSNLGVRIGGIYALERIARDSVRDSPVVMEVLAAFVREESQHQWPAATEGDTPERTTRPDVQAAVTVIGRRDVDGTGPINLSRAVLTRADLTRANFSRANLYGADLTDSNLARSDLSRVNLAEARLADANFWHADLSEAEFNNANLSGANLASTNLTGAVLNGANLAAACLGYAQLTGATFTGSDITGAEFTDAEFAAVPGPHPPEPPAGWVVDASTSRLKRAFGQTID